MDSISPNIFVKNINATIAFYKKIGFEVVITVPDEGEPSFAMMSCGQISFMFQTFNSLGDDLPEIQRNPGGSILLYIQLQKVKAFFDQIQDKVEILKPLETTFYGATEFSIVDNNGFVLTFAEINPR
ncbi:MAG: VOC family protein [Bacteroidia bacterium]|nr:VOC family protein [Bacteroidia bacterium]